LGEGITIQWVRRDLRSCEHPHSPMGSQLEPEFPKHMILGKKMGNSMNSMGSESYIYIDIYDTYNGNSW
jgi:hypothetical protein